MCGRARCTLQPKEIPRACGINDESVQNLHMERYTPSYNVSPGFHLPVVRKEEGSGHGAVIHCMKWGLIPSFNKKTEKPDHFRMFNARSESICEKASFRRLVPNKRCLVAVEGFYEWKKDGSKKQPYYIHFKDHRPLVLAALYDSWGNSEGEILYTFTILTTCCSSTLQWLHDRMPVILGNNDSINAWLNGSPSSKFDTLLQPYEGLDLAWYPVPAAMGKLSFNGPECIKEIQLKPEEKNSISRFFSSKTADTKLELDPLVKNSPEESARTDQFVSVKEEPITEENKELLIGSEQDNIDAKPDVSSSPNKETELCGIKRDYESFSTDMKPSTANVDKGFTDSLKKKGRVKNSGDKQPTLLSYFGRS